MDTHTPPGPKYDDYDGRGCDETPSPLLGVKTSSGYDSPKSKEDHSCLGLFFVDSTSSPVGKEPSRCLIFCVLFSFGLVDCLTDWLLYVDVSRMEEGLVYGPPGDAAVYALLVFSIIGSFTFVLVAVDLWQDNFGERCLPADLATAVAIWLEDLPQVIINERIGSCREHSVTAFQQIKAAFILVFMVLQGLYLWYKKPHKYLLSCIVLAIGFNIGFATTLFVHKLHHAAVTDQIPQAIFENVSVFVHHPDFDVSTPPNASTGFEANWVHVMSINDIWDQEDRDISYSYIYEKNTTQLKMALYIKEDGAAKRQNGKWDLLECIQMDRATGNVTAVDNSTCRTSFFTSGALRFFLTFSFTPPDLIFSKFVLGDIRFNLEQHGPNGTCSDPDNFADNMGNSLAAPSLRYYWHNTTVSADQTRFFHRLDGQDLQDITEVWKTGITGKCEMSGSVGPHLDRGIPTECSN